MSSSQTAAPKAAIQLDAAAAAPVDPETLAAFSSFALRFGANQEGAGLLSREAAQEVSGASVRLAKALLQDPLAGVLWANTGTDALLAAVEACGAVRKGAVVTSDGEHPALTKALERLCAASGRPLFKVRLAEDGTVNLNSLKSLLTPETAIVALHHVQSETGAVQDLKAIRAVMDEAAPKALFVSDTTQSACKIPIPWKEARIDFASASGSKIGAPAGAALLYRDSQDKLVGKVLKAMRSSEHRLGRCAPAACLALAFAAERLAPSIAKRLEEAAKVKEAFKAEIEKALPGKIRFNASGATASPYILHMLVRGLQGATLVRMLADKGYGVAAGSACEAEAPEPSKVLLTMGVKKSEAYSALRLSFWSGNSPSEAPAFAEALAACVKAY